jgi:hypothetical protein
MKKIMTRGQMKLTKKKTINLKSKNKKKHKAELVIEKLKKMQRHPKF